MVVMAHGLNSVLKRGANVIGNKSETKTGIGSRRIFPPHFKLQVLDSYRHDADCKGNQRATARKYGIHRRQIQKWLQAENNLRNSVVGKGNQSECGDATKCGLELALRSGCHRQRDDSAADAYSRCGAGVGVEARVPALSPIAFTESGWHEAKPAAAPKAERPESARSGDCPHTHHQHPGSGSTVPLDFTTHSRAEPLAPQRSDLATPMDLSLKRPISIAPAADHRLPTKYAALSPTTPPFCLAQPTYTTTPPLTFSAYQPVASPAHSSQSTHHDSDTEIWDLSTKTVTCKKENSPPPPTVPSPTPPKAVKLFKPYLDDMHENSSSSEGSQVKSLELKTEFSDSITYQPYYNNNIYEYKSDYSYTLHELQPKPVSPNSPYYYPISYVNQDGEINYGYEDPNHVQFKQRQSYSLDFKLQAIECYYQDEMCRGNQRAVASKYNIHRRQVQKWLKQEEELRQRNESVKQIHAVR